MHYLYVLIYKKAAAAAPLSSKISCGPQNYQCVHFPCKGPLDADRPRVVVRAELSCCVSDSPGPNAELLRMENTTRGARMEDTGREGSRALGLCATHYLKMGSVLPNTNLLMVGYLNYTHRDFS